MRRRLALAAAVAFVFASALPAHGGGSASIDHVESRAGSVRMLVSIPADAQGPALSDVTVRVDGRPVQATASANDSRAVQRTAVLALDVSNSMRGERFAAAKDAAHAFLEAAPEDIAVGLVTFSEEVTTHHRPTTDHRSVEQAVDELSLHRGTFLYDGVLEALALTGRQGQRDVIVLSDGADTSQTPLAEVLAAAESSDVAVNVVALPQGGAARVALQQMTRASGGDYASADRPSALARVLHEKADALAQQVLVEFDAPRSDDVTISVSIPATDTAYTDSTYTSITAARSAAPAPEAPEAGVATAVDRRLLLGGLAALGTGLATAVVVLLHGRSDTRRRQSVQRRIGFYTSSKEPGDARPDGASDATATSARDAAVSAAGKVLTRTGLEDRLNQRLTTAGLGLTGAEWLLLHAGVLVAAMAVGLLLGGIALLLLPLLGAVVPWVIVGVKAGRRVKAFNAQLPDTLQLMSGGLSAGLSLAQAVDTVVREGSEPMAGELRRALVEQRLGVDIEDALDGVADRMKSKDFEWVVMAIRIQREVGGNLAELLGTVANTIREREYLRRQVKTLSAEGRLSAWILGGLPIAFAAYLGLTRPEYVSTLYTTPVGWMLTISACVLMALGTVVMKTVVKVEV